MAEDASVMDGELGPDWSVHADIGELALALPDAPEPHELAGATGRLLISDEFGDAFGVIEGPDEALPFALGRALDQLFGTEWGTADAPTVDAAVGQASFDAFGQHYVAHWQRHASTLLFAIVQPEREARARAFVTGDSIRR